jgi:hypothetical protein
VLLVRGWDVQVICFLKITITHSGLLYYLFDVARERTRSRSRSSFFVAGRSERGRSFTDEDRQTLATCSTVVSTGRYPYTDCCTGLPVEVLYNLGDIPV